LTSQNPITKFENYPRTSADLASEVVPEVETSPSSPRLPTSMSAPVDTRKMGWNLSSASLSRRSALGWLVGIPVVAFIGIEAFGSRSGITASQDDDPFQTAVLAAVPGDWDVSQNSRGWAIHHGSNEVRAVVLEDQGGEDATRRCPRCSPR